MITLIEAVCLAEHQFSKELGDEIINFNPTLYLDRAMETITHIQGLTVESIIRSLSEFEWKCINLSTQESIEPGDLHIVLKWPRMRYTEKMKQEVSELLRPCGGKIGEIDKNNVIPITFTPLLLVNNATDINFIGISNEQYITKLYVGPSTKVFDSKFPDIVYHRRNSKRGASTYLYNKTPIQTHAMFRHASFLPNSVATVYHMRFIA